MKILSISDVITNSSSEVFCFYDKRSDKRIRELVTCILETFGIKESFDDLFTIKYEISDRAEEDNFSVEEALNEYSDDNGLPYISGYKIIPKSNKYTKLCNLLSKLDTIFDYEEVYS